MPMLRVTPAKAATLVLVGVGSAYLDRAFPRLDTFGLVSKPGKFLEIGSLIVGAAMTANGTAHPDLADGLLEAGLALAGRRLSEYHAYCKRTDEPASQSAPCGSCAGCPCSAH